MPLGKILSEEEIGQIRAYKDVGVSNREIARRLHRSPRVINNYINDPENYGKRHRRAVKTATTSRERRQILKEASIIQR
ncbi:Transposable element Tc3 transposase [Anthophora plagiata]